MNEFYREQLENTTFTVVDLETTGGVKPENAIIELSAFRFSGGRITDEFTTLINPKKSIPFFITEYTGITNEMVKHAPTFDSIIPSLLPFFEHSIFVAHNAQFDFGFINQELSKSGIFPLTNPTLCTVRLARRLTPKTVRKNLGDLTSYFGIKIESRHRARGDCLATVFLLDELIKTAKYKYDAEVAGELMQLQFQPMRHFRREPKRTASLREMAGEEIAERPGVYKFYDAQKRLLYIGKSKNLRARVLSYFNSPDHHSDKVKDLVKSISSIETQVTGSELEALILESRLIKKHTPPFNTLLAQYKRYPFLKLSASPFPRLELALEIQPDGAEYFGPFTSKEFTLELFDIINKHFLLRECSDAEFRKGRSCIYKELERCTAPCEAPEKVDSYHAIVRQVRQFLTGEDAEIIEHLSEKMKALGKAQRFEDAALLRDRIETLKRVFYRQALVTSSVNENNLVIFLPHHDSTAANVSVRCKLLFIRFGRLVGDAIYTPEDIDTISERLYDGYFQNSEVPGSIHQEEIDEMQIISSWIYRHRTTLSCLYLSREVLPQATIASIKEVLLNRFNEWVASQKPTLSQSAVS